MKLDPNDPRLTAYALGELDEFERATVEAALRDNPELRRELESIRRTTDRLTTELQTEPCPELTPQQQRAIEESLNELTTTEPSFSWSKLWWTLGFAGAMAIVLGSLFLHTQKPAREQQQTVKLRVPNETAGRDEPPARQLPWDADQRATRRVAPTSTALTGGVVINATSLNLSKYIGAPYVAISAGTGTGATAVALFDYISGTVTGILVTSAGAGYTNAPTVTLIGGGNTNFTLDRSAISLAANVSGSSGLFKQSAGTLMLNGTNMINLVSGVVTMNVANTYTGGTVVNGGIVDFNSGAFRGHGPKVGAGLLTLSGNNTYAGGTRIGYGGIAIDNANRMGAGAYSLGRIGDGSNPSAPTAGTAPVPWQQYPAREDALRYYPGGESYEAYGENPFVTVTEQPLSTFGLDVDTASYANIRRFIGERQLPPRDAVRIEEMLNYFKYNYAPPPSGQPFALHVEMAECPWNSAHRLALIGLKAKEIPAHKRPASNLVFLIDVSGSMQPVNKLPLIKRAFHLLVGQLDERDRVAIVVYASNARILLRSTNATDKDRILAAIDSLKADGSTNGGEGIQWAYEQARQNFIVGGVNRVILCTDGDFNVGITDQNSLVSLIQQQAKSGVFLSVLGFGMGNIKDSTMQKLADKGNGHYAYIDDLDEARKVFVEQLQATLVTVAKDAKLQVEFNPAVAQSYRLIGYEKRRLRAQDFNNDRKDAGEVGAGHTVTALYEIIPASSPGEPGVDPLKYQPQPPPRRGVSDEAMTVKLRYKEPDSDTSKLLTAAVKDTQQRWNKTSDDFRFAAAVAEFGMLLRGSQYSGNANFDSVIDLARSGCGRDEGGYREEFISLVRQAQRIVRPGAPDDR
jgi:Ca-activated chloride channel family protein